MSYYNSLSGVTAISSSNVWAVGASSSEASGDSNLIEHWDGGTWSLEQAPPVPLSSLSAASALSSSDVWAVGRRYSSKAGRDKTLTEHWDGASWSLVRSPNRGTISN